MNNEITNKINLILLILGLFLGLTIGVFLLFKKSRKTSANIYLGILVLLSLSYFVPGFLYRFDLIEKFPHTIGFAKVINVLIGPLTYLYVRACTQKGYKMLPIFWLHFVPFILLCIYHNSSLIASGEIKLTELYLAIEKRSLQVNKYMMGIQSIYNIIYFALSIQLIFQYKKHLGNIMSYFDRSFYSWVLIFIFIHALPIVSMTFSYIFSSFGEELFMSVLLSFFLFNLAVYFALLIKPELFHAFPHQMPFPDSKENKTKRYESSNLQEDQKKIYLKKLVQHIELNKPYQETEYTLNQLAEQTNIPSHYVSQVINEKMNCNFIEFINGYRIQDAKLKLVDKKYSHYTIVAIAYEVGFNSKSAFYSAFKKNVGTTPSHYRKSLVR